MDGALNALGLFIFISVMGWIEVFEGDVCIMNCVGDFPASVGDAIPGAYNG